MGTNALALDGLSLVAAAGAPTVALFHDRENLWRTGVPLLWAVISQCDQRRLPLQCAYRFRTVNLSTAVGSISPRSCPRTQILRSVTSSSAKGWMQKQETSLVVYSATS